MNTKDFPDRPGESPPARNERAGESVWWYEVTGAYALIRYRIWKRTGEWGDVRFFSVRNRNRFGALRAFAEEMNFKNLPFEVLSFEMRDIYVQRFGSFLPDPEEEE